ncbi:23S rRNA (uracil(1939)-C(5))-methyltransferase RlmD [Pseudobacteroides cellulosolvens]|uniref:RNA methyltransferase, TrmA family n=1 Tax=Pseudobacteroides cellulosolvens ATCC 35603 = DSM 2933 TaxID=398512 RepID=A0A0L6JVT3_9FIRM|nr:23S rRNA (uracil(1939)-C(5))-methyltransferase RlmD [Pseudobacteroides cellulosolvens]KNY29547.1 RNA methyltransferase, TrmA family [Pseudobacteroides cellulosolvens ATCC 35603 = DSM 2933]
MPIVEINKEYRITITGMNHEGQGVGRVDGFTVFVDDALEGEEVLVKITKVNKSYSVGRLVEIINPSDNRTQPFCTSFEKCGGCSLQHMSMDAQLRFKTNLVKESVKRIGKLENVVIHDTIGMKDSLYYRNKAQYPVGISLNKPIAGFYARRSHEIIECKGCGIQNKTSDRIKDIISEFIYRNKIVPYDETKGTGLVRHIMTREGFKTGETMVVIVINGKDFPHKDKLVQELVHKEPSVKSIYLNINRKNTNIIMGEENVKIYGEDFITEYIEDLKFRISPLAFFQVNPVQTGVLYGKALQYAKLTGNEVVYDLYCGTGTISLFLARKAKRVYGIEIVADAIKDAVKNAEINGIKNAEFIVGEAENVELTQKADVVVLDPPRKGCDEKLLATLVDMGPKRIVYVSCNPSTLARDLKYLAENGFEVREVQPVDMFPHTAHVECVVRIQRKN